MPETPIESTEATFIFIDLINSSSFSSFINSMEYAEWILMFQNIFEDLAIKYFSEDSFIKTAGDEGFVFIPKSIYDLKISTYKTICFAFELKTLIKLESYEKSGGKLMPHGLRLAVGIHCGQVNYTYKPIQKDGQWKSKIEKYIGYNINYAKRIESCSRSGKYSNIFVSQNVYEILKSQKPIFFELNRSELKGLEKSIDTYEVRSIFINDEPMKKILHEKYIKYFDLDKDFFYNKKEYWFNSYYLSIIYQLSKEAKGNSNEKYYENLLKNRLFRYFEIDDPVVEFIQAIYYLKNDDLTLTIKKLRKILNNYPEFIYAKIELLKSLLELQKKSNNKNSEIIYLLDSTKELLNYFSTLLTNEEKEILKRIQSETEEIDK